MIENQEATLRPIQSKLQTRDTHGVYEERKWREARNGIYVWPSANHKSGMLGDVVKERLANSLIKKKNGCDGFVLYLFIFLSQQIQFVAIQSECLWGLDE